MKSKEPFDCFGSLALAVGWLGSDGLPWNWLLAVFFFLGAIYDARFGLNAVGRIYGDELCLMLCYMFERFSGC
jgi:hypothetical protein